MVNQHGEVAEFLRPYKMQSRVLFDECPVCKAAITSHAFDGQHTNGQWNETKKFRCGSAYRWWPNGSCLETTEPCPHSKEGREKIDRAYLVGLLTDYKLYEVYKKWPLDLLARLVKEHERCEEMITERQLRRAHMEKWRNTPSGFADFIKNTTQEQNP